MQRCQPDPKKPQLTPDEIARRREADRQAKACNRIAGIPHDPTTDPIFEAWILGEIDSDLPSFSRQSNRSLGRVSPTTS